MGGRRGLNSLRCASRVVEWVGGCSAKGGEHDVQRSEARQSTDSLFVCVGGEHQFAHICSTYGFAVFAVLNWSIASFALDNLEGLSVLKRELTSLPASCMRTLRGRLRHVYEESRAQKRQS
jgi:hypothetical protein